MGDLLKEAIADAKAVRETALANAKMALEEAFTPQLKSMLSAKLREEDDEFEDEEGGEEGNPFSDEEEDEVPAEEYAENGEDEFGDEEGGEEEFGDEEGGDNIDIDIDADGDDEEEVEENIIELNGQAFKLVPIQEDEFSEGEDNYDDNLDLEAIVNELEQEISEDDSDDSDDSDNVVSEDDKDDEKNVDESKDEDYEIDESLFTEDDEEELDEEVDESSGIGSGSGRGGTDKSSAIGSGGQEKAQALESVQAELKEYKEAVSFLKDKLHEVNILNAKLLFTNKLFKEFALDNNQKLKVVETFDRTQSTREIKLVYSTLAEQFGDNGSISKKYSIKESASSAVGSTKPSKESRKVITEEEEVAKRFKKLANIL